MRLRYSIIFVSDLDRSLRFYHELLGIPVRSEDPGSVELDTGGATLALHRAHVTAGQHHPPMQAGSCRIGFEVEDLDHVHARLMVAGVRCLTQPEQRFDYRVALYEDPDGVNLTLAESATEHALTGIPAQTPG